MPHVGHCGELDRRGEGRVLEGTVAQRIDLEGPLGVGERVRFRSLQWEVGERLVTLFGCERASRGRRLKAILGLGPIERTMPPCPVCRIDEKGWNHAEFTVAVIGTHGKRPVS